MKSPVSHALIVVLLILTLSACAVLDANPEATISPDTKALVEANPDSKAAGITPSEEVGDPSGESPDENSSISFRPIHEGTFIDLYQRANPAVVNIQVTTEVEINGDGEGDFRLPDVPGIPGFPFQEMPDLQPMPQQGQGSGFVYDKAGHIVTNNHVVANADEITVVFADGTEADASLVGADPDTDLAVIKVEGVNEELLIPLALGDSDDLQVGQHVVAIGNPFGLAGSMTTGIISGLGRVLPAGATQFSIPDIIQTDAAINPGNSGGPLLNLDGEVIGVNSAIASPNRAFAGVAYAVPVNIVHEVVPELIAKGRVEHPWLGILGRAMDRATAEAMNLVTEQRGVLIAEVVADSPAFESELRGSDTQVTIDGQEARVGGDVIVGIDDVSVNDFDDLLSYIVSETEVGQTVTLQVLRDGEPLEIVVTLAARPVNGE